MAEKTQSDDQKLVGTWIAELDACEQWSRNYRERCKRIERRYRSENATADNQPDSTNRRYAILWSNIQTLGPAVYARTPNAEVSRRYKDQDPTGRYASEVLERALNFSIDQYDFGGEVMEPCRDDYLLVGRSQAWVRYVPHEAPKAPGKPEQDSPDDPQITNAAEEDAQQNGYAEVICDHVNNEDWGFTPCREWPEAWYVWRRVYMTKEENIERFGRKIGSKIPLDWKPKDDPQESNGYRTRAKKSANYEIWDKNAREVIWVNKSWPDGVLDRRPDWLKLDGFFPCPRPMMATTPRDKYLPIPDYVYYQDQAEEVDDLTARIANLSDALRMVGIYAGEMNDALQNMFQGRNNELIPVSSMANLADKGGMKGIIEWMPIETVIATLTGCVEARKQQLDDIYQITGISDIIRGATDPSETATAQGIKEQWGALRVRDKQKEIARFARDLLRIKGQIIAQNYQPQMLAAMTDIQLPTAQQKQAVAQAQQQQIPVPPQLQEIAGRPTWEDVSGLLTNDALRGFRIDIETDSTVEPNQQEEKARRVEFVTAMSSFIGAAAQVIPIMPQITPLAGETLKFLARGFEAGREMEDAIERFVDGVTQSPPQPPQKQGAQGQQDLGPMEAQIKQAELQQKGQIAQGQQQVDAQRLQLEHAKAQGEQQATQGQQAIDAGHLQLDHTAQQLDARELQLKAFALSKDPKPQGNA